MKTTVSNLETKLLSDGKMLFKGGYYHIKGGNNLKSLIGLETNDLRSTNIADCTSIPTNNAGGCTNPIHCQ